LAKNEDQRVHDVAQLFRRLLDAPEEKQGSLQTISKTKEVVKYRLKGAFGKMRKAG